MGTGGGIGMGGVIRIYFTGWLLTAVVLSAVEINAKKLEDKEFIDIFQGKRFIRMVEVC